MNPIIQMILQKLSSGMLQNDPNFTNYQQMFAGKTPEQQYNVLINLAKNANIDINSKIFTTSDLRAMKLIP